MPSLATGRNARRQRLAAAIVVGAVIVSGCGPSVSISSGHNGPTESSARRAEPPQPVPLATTSEPRQQSNAVFQAGLAGASGSLLRTAPPVSISIPAIELEAPVVATGSTFTEAGWTWEIPPDSAGHLLGTANPGEPGNIVISGHVETTQGTGVFSRIPELQAGDTIDLRSPSGQHRYVVVSIEVVEPGATSVLAQQAHEVLTLITCVPDGVYDDRLVVRARRATA